MDQALIKMIVKTKVEIAGRIIDCLPEKAAKEIRDFGKLVLESIEEDLKERDQGEKARGGINKIEIE